MRNRHYQRRRPTLFLTGLGVVALLCCATLSDAQAQNTLRKIEIVGLQRLPADQVIQSTGLQLGQRIEPSMIEAASDKLMKSGWFRTVSYRVRNADNESTVIFEVSENAPRAPSAGEVLGQVKWYENRALSSAELSTAFGLQTGEPADRSKIDKGLAAVRKAYAGKGFIDAHISEFRTNDAANRRIHYEFTVREGQQFRMGALTITGLGPADTQRLKTKWTLAPGAVFNDAYLDEYKQNTVRPFVAAMTDRTGVRSKFDFETKPDVRKQTVDVVVNFK